jgi:Polyketide cyclase / dehydrase and lipid transport
MTQYAFATTWVLDAPIDPVWSTLQDTTRWREWFRAFREVEVVEPGGPDGVGAVLEVTTRATLPYDLVARVQVTRVEAPRLLEVTALGDLEGTGRGTLAEEDGVTTLRFEWRVATTKPWMNALAPVARPVFAWNHDVAMTAAGRGLAEQLGVRLLANESGPVEHGEDRLASATLLTAVVLVGAAVLVGRRRLRRS